MATTILSLDAVLYRNTGTFVSPTWNVVSDVKDLSLTMEKSEADASTRASKWKLVRGALKAATLTFTMVYDPTDDDWAALKTAFLGHTTIGMGIADGLVATPGTEYLKADFEVLKFSHTENLEEVIVTEVEMKPTRSGNDPTWVVVGG